MTTTSLRAKLENYFKVGSVVPSYGNKLDKVIAFTWDDSKPFSWFVTVQAINKDGSTDKSFPYPRTHATQPNFN